MEFGDRAGVAVNDVLPVVGGVDEGGVAALGGPVDVLAGAAIGTMIPVPVVGTAVGALVGAGVGIFTSGMVDNLFEGGSVGDALGAGWDAVEDTGEAIGDGLESAGDAIGDGIESVGDAIGGLFG